MSTVHPGRNNRLSSWSLVFGLVSAVRWLSAGQSVQQDTVSLSDESKADVNTGIVRDDARTLDLRPLAGWVDRASCDVMCPLGFLWPVHDDELFPRIDQAEILPTQLLGRVDGVFSSDPDLIHVQAWEFREVFGQNDQNKSAFWVAVLYLADNWLIAGLYLSFNCREAGCNHTSLSACPAIQNLADNCPLIVRLAVFCLNPLYSVRCPACPTVRQNGREKLTTYPKGIGMTLMAAFIHISYHHLYPHYSISLFFLRWHFCAARKIFSERKFL